jgi:hypothetical protein
MKTNNSSSWKEKGFFLSLKKIPVETVKIVSIRTASANLLSDFDRKQATALQSRYTLFLGSVQVTHGIFLTSARSMN